MADPRDDFAAIPILMELVREAPEVRAVTTPEFPLPARPLPGREAQQSLFDDLPEAPPRAAVKRGKLSPGLHRLAEDMLRVRAPAIINELADEHARRLAGELRERLRRELARLLAELAEQDPDEAVAAGTSVPGQRQPPTVSGQPDDAGN